MTTSPSPQSLQILRSERRFTTNAGWITSQHCFSFGEHFDSRNTHFGILIVHNEDVIEPAGGYEMHEHADTEIVSWVMSGSLLHRDSQGRMNLVPAGHVQQLGAGTGVTHSEMNETWPVPAGVDPEPLHFVQMWLPPHEKGLDPSYSFADVRPQLKKGGLFVVASGMDKHISTAAVRIRQKHAALHAADMGNENVVVLPDAPFVHVFVTRGSIDLEGASMMFVGDSARIAGGGGQRVVAGPEGAEILVWEMYASF